MKKVTILTISMLMINGKMITAPEDLQVAQTKVNGAIQRISQQQQRKTSLEAQIKQEQNSLLQIQGDPEYADDYTTRQEQIRNLINQYNSCVDEYKSGIDHMGKELRNVSSRYYVTGENGKYEVSKPSYKKPAAIVHKPVPIKFSDRI